MRELVARLGASEAGAGGGPPPVVITLANPGLCRSGLDRDGPAPGPALRALRAVVDRTAEAGGRALVHGAAAPAAAHGALLSDGRPQDVEAWIYADVGRRAQRKVFEQTAAVLERRKPSIAAAAGLCLGPLG